MADDFEQDWADVTSGNWTPDEVAAGQDITGNADAAALGSDWYDSFLQSIGITPATATGTGASPSNAQIAASLGLGSNSTAAGLQNLLKAATGGAGTGSQLATLVPLLGGLYAASQSNQRTQPAGYQGGIPRYVATRQAPAAGQRLSGNVTYTPKAEGGELEAGGFVIPADVVSHFGNGSSDAGLKILAAKLGAEPIRGDGDGMSDSIPTTIDGREKALVAHEEAYVSPERVAAIGGGSAKKGAEKLRTMMDRIREARTGSTEQGKQINPTKFMPGGEVKRYATGNEITGSAISSGLTGTESSLSNWAGPYVTDMLAKGQALSELPYEQFQGPLTAGPSALQTQAFNTAANLQTPAAIGQATTTAGGLADAYKNLKYTPVGTDFTAGIAQQYMNPYLQAALDPQMAELKRQADIKRMDDAARLTKAGAFGGSRQAVMESEGARNLLDLQRKALGEGYATAYDKAMAQFNADQSRKVQEAQYGTDFGLKGLSGALSAAQAQGQLGATQQKADLENLAALTGLGATQRDIAQQGITAEKTAFDEARTNPYKMVQFQQSLLSGLPLAAQTYNVTPTNNLSQFMGGLATVSDLLAKLGQAGNTATS